MRLANIGAQRLPQVSLSGQATYQNEVPNLPGQFSGPTPPLDQYRVQADMDWLIYDGGRLNREVEVEHARLSESLAGIEATLKALREGATETFFAALLFQSRQETLALAAEDVEARLSLVQARVRDGAAVEADAAALEAELIRLRQQADKAHSDKRAALAVLSQLLDTEIAEETVFTLPGLEGDIPALIPSLQTGPGKIETPETQLLRGQQNRLEAEARVARAVRRPQLSLFGQAGVGRPGPFNFLSQDLNEFGLIGIRMRWSLIDWGRSRRQSEILGHQAAMTRLDRASTQRRILRDVQDDRAEIVRLQAALVDDRRAVTLRQQVLDAAGRQLEEGVLLAADFADRVTDLAEARLIEQQHRIELERARVRLLAALGLYPEESL